MKIISCYSIKGGVGKTALAVNLAYGFHAAGYRTLLVDLDPQGASAFYFRIAAAEKFKMEDSKSMFAGLRRNVRESDFQGLDIIPSNLAYRHFDIALHGMKKRRSQLRETLNGFNEDYDIIVLDCPPNLTLLSENIFRATDLILVPVIPTVLSQRTYEQLVDFFSNKDLSKDLLRPVFSMVQRRSRLHRDIMKALSEMHPEFMKSVIPFSTDIEKMGIHRTPLLAYSKSSPASLAVQELCDEILTDLEVL